MLELYQSQVNEIDKKGYAEIFVKCTEAFFKEWKKDFMNFNYRQGDKIYTPLDYITYHLYENFVKAQARIYKSRKF